MATTLGPIIKQLEEKQRRIYPVAVGEAVIFRDNTNAEVSEDTMDTIFGWNRNYISFVTVDSENYVEWNPALDPDFIVDVDVDPEEL